MDNARKELATVLRLIRKERPDLARKLRKFLYVVTIERLIMSGHLVPVVQDVPIPGQTVH